jgi:hypothetical protein
MTREVAGWRKGTTNQALQQTGAACSFLGFIAHSAAPAAELGRSATIAPVGVPDDQAQGLGY